MDELDAEVYNYGGDYLCTMLKHVIQKVWYREVGPSDWRNATVEIVYKTKGGKDNNCGICLLVVPGKVFVS